MKEADIVKVHIPQADGRAKFRPAVLLRELPEHGDYLLCGISSKTFHFIDGFDEIIYDNDSDFKQSNLITTSLIRLGFLAVAPVNTIAGSIGCISAERHQRLLSNLANYLTKNLNINP